MGLAEALDASCRKNGAASCSDRHRSADGFSVMVMTAYRRFSPRRQASISDTPGTPIRRPRCARVSLDRHAAYIVAACVTGAAQ